MKKKLFLFLEKKWLSDNSHIFDGDNKKFSEYIEIASKFFMFFFQLQNEFCTQTNIFQKKLQINFNFLSA